MKCMPRGCLFTHLAELNICECCMSGLLKQPEECKQSLCHDFIWKACISGSCQDVHDGVGTIPVEGGYSNNEG